MVDYVVGDTVMRTRGEYNGMRTGDTGVVLQVSDDYVRVAGFGDGHEPTALQWHWSESRARQLQADAIAAVLQYNIYLERYQPPFKPIVLDTSK